MGEGLLNQTPCIAPDESYLLFSCKRHNTQRDIYISFRQSDETYTEDFNLSEALHTNGGELFTTLSIDDKYLLFIRCVASGNEDVMWVSSDVIDKLREDHL